MSRALGRLLLRPEQCHRCPPECGNWMHHDIIHLVESPYHLGALRWVCEPWDLNEPVARIVLLMSRHA